jgi:hypothetical protein
MAEPYPHFLPELYEELQGCVAQTPMSPSKLRRYFLLLLRGHWSDAQNYGPDISENLACMEWNPDARQSTISVELQGTDNPDQKVPAIWVKLGNFQFKHTSFGDLAEIEQDNATKIIVMPATAQLLIKHEAAALDTAYDMAWSTLCFLMGFQEAVRAGLGGSMAAFKPQIVGEPIREEKQPQTRFRVDVGAQLSLNVAVTTTLESHKLKRVEQTISPI